MFSRKYHLLLNLILTFLLIININSFSVIGNFNVSKDSLRTYSVNENEWKIILQEKTANGNGFTINENKFSSGEEFDVLVTDVRTDSIKYSIFRETHTESHEITMFAIKSLITKFQSYPLSIFNNFCDENWNKSKIENGPPILQLFFLKPTEETWDFFDDLTNESSLMLFTQISEFQEITTIDAKFQRTGEVIIFDFYILGKISQGEDFSGNIEHNIKIVWNQVKGSLKGYRTDSELSGTYKNDRVRISIQSEIEENNYRLPNFEFGPRVFIPGFKGLIALSTLFFLTFIKNKKRKKL